MFDCTVFYAMMTSSDSANQKEPNRPSRLTSGTPHMQEFATIGAQEFLRDLF